MSRPNILFCLADDAGMHLGAYGCEWVETPGFDRVARDGILFTQTFTPNAKCAPSRACILTGRNPWQLGAAANHQTHFPARFKTSFESLADAGYHTGHTGKGWAPGDPGSVDGEPRELTGTRYDEKTATPPTADMSDCDYAANFEDFLEDNSDDRPFSFWFGCREPHRPYEYGSGRTNGGKDTADIDHVYPIWPDNEVVRNDLLDYGYAIEHFDHHLRQMLEALETRGELENTLVVVTSDNGMPFPRAKGQEYYYSNHLPLAIMWPSGIERPGRIVDEMVSFIDFTPTFLEVAGLSTETAEMEPVEGESLVDILKRQADLDRNYVLIGKERHDLGRPGDVGYPIRGIFRDGYLYLRNFEPERWPAGNPETGYMNTDGSPTKTEILQRKDDPGYRKYWEWSFGKRPLEELYAIDEDPACLRNLADSDEHADVQQALWKMMRGELQRQGDPRIHGEGDSFDNYPTASTALADFYGRFMAGELAPASWINESDIEPIEELREF